MIVKERDISIDIAKGIGILLVVLGHLELNSVLMNTIYFFHMPLFFFASGIFINEKSSNKSLFMKDFSLLKNYFFYGLIFIAISFFTHKSNILNSVYNLIMINALDSSSINFFIICWFIPAMISVKLLYRFTGYYGLFFSLIACILIYLSFTNKIVNLPMCLTQAALVYPFFYLGRYYNEIKHRINVYYIIALFISFIVLATVIIYLYNGLDKKITNIHQLVYPNAISFYILGLIGTILILSLSTFVNQRRNYVTVFLELFGKNSFLIFITHLFIFYVFKKILGIIQVHGISKQVLIFLFTIITLFITLKLLERCRKYIPETIFKLISGS